MAGRGEQKVRPAAVAGAFYPADPQELSQMIDEMLAKATPPPVDGAILAAVAPHAGYPYSGPVAAWTYAAIEHERGHKYSRVVVIAPSHYVGFDFTSVYDGDAYTTPLGQVPVDKEFARRLAKMSATIQLSDKGHQATADAPEHSVEVQLPWLQKILGNFELVPIVMGDQSYESSRALGVALAKMLRDDHDTLVVASSDLSHYHPYADAETIDHKTLHALEAWDYFSMSRNFFAASAGNLGGLRRRAHRGRHDLRRAHGREPGRGAQVRELRRHYRRPFARGRLQRRSLRQVRAARRRGAALLAHRPGKDRAARAGAQVGRVRDPEQGALCARQRPRARRSTASTAHSSRSPKAAQLRGCIGYTSPIKPLYMTVRDTATLAALRDPRFRAGGGRGTAQAGLRDLRALAAAPRDRRRADQGGPRRAAS